MQDHHRKRNARTYLKNVLKSTDKFEHEKMCSEYKKYFE